MNIKILDCTLRDGGYINNWSFNESHTIKILNSLNQSKINIVECGYINDKNGEIKDTTLFDSLDSVDQVLKNIDFNENIEKVIMINLGDYDVANLPPKEQTSIDGIRLAFHKKDIELAFQIASKIKESGYKLYFQPMVTKNYKDIEFLDIIERVNSLKPDAFYIVDSFGSMTLKEFHKYLILSDNNLANNISLGYHSHNNMQLAFSNAISMCMQNLKREIIIDSSIYGIGRGAGNLNTELISDHLNKTYDKNYDALPLLEIIDELLASLMVKNSWGFSPAQFLSASYNCHPNYATYLVNKNTNYIVSIKKILDKLPDDKKSSFDKELAEKLYRNYILESKSDLKGNFQLTIDKNILLIASGPSVIEYKELLEAKEKDSNYQIVALNHKPDDINCDYYFFTNQKRYDEFQDKIESDKIVITNNIQIVTDPIAVLDFKQLVLGNNELVTNSTILAINFLIQTGHKKVEIAGLDGYKLGKENYSYDENQIVIDVKSQLAENQIIENSLQQFSNKIDINIITPSIFKGGLV